MAEPTDTEDPAQSAASDVREKVPTGYRQGVLAAIAVILGFSLSFLQYWGFEAEGEWTVISIIAAFILMLGTGLMIMTLWRSLQVEDDYVDVYQTTLRWFLASILVVFLSLVIAMVAYSGYLAERSPELNPARVCFDLGSGELPEIFVPFQHDVLHPVADVHPNRRSGC
jgi:hypothetical protein